VLREHGDIAGTPIALPALRGGPNSVSAGALLRPQRRC
jgi:hypothetical protein